MFFPYSSLQSISSKKQILTQILTISLVKQTLAFKPINFLGKQTQKNPTGKKKKKKPQITTTELKNMKIKPKKKNRNLATKWQKLIINLVDDFFTPSKIFFYWSENFKFFKNISIAHRERARERERDWETLWASVSERWRREKNQKKREKKKLQFFLFLFSEARQRKMKIKNKGKVYPSPSSSSSSSLAIPCHSDGDFLSVLKLLPATILALASVLSLEDREVLAYMITPLHENHNLISNHPRFQAKTSKESPK